MYAYILLFWLGIASASLQTIQEQRVFHLCSLLLPKFEQLTIRYSTIHWFFASRLLRVTYVVDHGTSCMKEEWRWKTWPSWPGTVQVSAHWRERIRILLKLSEAAIAQWNWRKRGNESRNDFARRVTLLYEVYSSTITCYGLVGPRQPSLLRLTKFYLSLGEAQRHHVNGFN